MNTEAITGFQTRVAKHAALADPARLRIVDLLTLGDFSPTELQAELGMPSNLLSHHLKVLREADLVISQRDGKGVKYALARGVELGRSHNGINLGCCSLTFKRVP